MAQRPPDVRTAVDDFLGTSKSLAGEATWTTAQREGDMRIKWPLLISGELSEASLTIISYPREPQLRFRIVLSYEKAIWRLDYVYDDHHVNSMDRPVNLPPGPINEPHVHTWALNRRFATGANLPSRLLNASILPRNIRSFDNAFRWFCGETNIHLGAGPLPELPKSDRLL